MLRKKERLTKKAFDRSFSIGKRFHSPSIQLIYVPGEDFHGAAVVGKKVFKKAVARNRLRRRLYGILYRLCKQTGLSGTFIVIAKPAAANAEQKELAQECAHLIAQTGAK